MKVTVLRLNARVRSPFCLQLLDAAFALLESSYSSGQIFRFSMSVYVSNK